MAFKCLLDHGHSTRLSNFSSIGELQLPKNKLMIRQRNYKLIKKLIGKQSLLVKKLETKLNNKPMKRQRTNKQKKRKNH